MQVHFGIGLLRAEWRKSVACVGTFDGVHLGHQAVIMEAVAQARLQELPCVLVTFDRHPAAILAPARCPKALAGLQENLQAFNSLGVSATVVLPFDAELSRMSAERFLREILIGAAKASRLVVGHDFAMGNGREGTAEWLSLRLPTSIVPPFEIDGVRVSSSAIRLAVAEGRMEDAARLLGRPFALSGVVVGGQKIGRKLGFPTANIARSFDQAVPAEGVYAGWLTASKCRFMAAISIGVRPAAGGGDQTVEAYLLDYPGDSLYGMPVELDLIHRLREERDFPSLDALTEQIHLDVEETRCSLTS
jgi:riboflavin kinase/FMN adenylyltransferase